MPYYGSQLSKQQKESIKQIVKKLNRIDVLKESDSPIAKMELTEMIYDGNVPKVSRKPQLSDYGLPNNVEIIIQEEKKKIEIEFEKKAKRARWLCAIALILVYVASFFVIKEKALYFLTTLGFVVFLIIIPSSFRKKTKPSKVRYEDEYNQYLKDEEAYSYWVTLRDYSYWDSLDGHAFERAVAALYRRLGYSVEVSKAGGDGGIDLLLRRDGETIAVQCKAHSKAVAPAVARDLYGTMNANNYSKGMIVSKNGFTKGVYEFVKGKDIQLIDLATLLKMQQSITTNA